MSVEVGDLVYHCIRWVPGARNKTKKGLGLVTMIVDVIAESKSKVRVVWDDGDVTWLPDTEVVLKTRVLLNKR